LGRTLKKDRKVSVDEVRIKKPGGEIKFSSRVNVWVLAPKSFGAVKRTNALVLLFLR
jgi:hypothetical protein